MFRLETGVLSRSLLNDDKINTNSYKLLIGIQDYLTSHSRNDMKYNTEGENKCSRNVKKKVAPVLKRLHAVFVSVGEEWVKGIGWVVPMEIYMYEGCSKWIAIVL